MTFDKNTRTQDRNELVTVLRNAGGENLQKRYIICPFHSDHVASAEIRQASITQRWYFYCHKCGIADDVWALQSRVEGTPVSSLLRDALRSDSGARAQATPPPRREKPSEELQTPNSPIFATVEDLINSYRRRNPQLVVEEVNPYTDPDTGILDLVTIRYLPEPGAKKVFAQATPVDGGWTYKGISGDKKTPLYNRTRLRTSDRALIVEGEKCVHAVTELGLEDIVAVTSAAGSKNARRCDWSPLAGKTVYLWADSDETGRAYTQEVIGYLKELNPPCVIYRIREEELELAEGGDVFDYIAENADDPATAIELALFDAEPLGAARSLADHFAKVAAGEYTLIEWMRKPHLTNATQALLPGTVTIVAGDPESGKSFFVLEEAWRQFEDGVPVRIMMLEDDHAFHLRRCLAQMSGESDILDHRHTETNITWAQELFARYEARLSAFGSVLEATGSEERSLFDVADWVEKSAAAGARLIVVDPITAASTGDMSWKDDRKFMMRAKKAAESYGCSVLLVTHPKLGKAGAPSLSGLAGGAAYGRFSQTVIWVKKYPELQLGSIYDGFTTKEGEYVRTVNIHKARSGRDGDKKTSRNLAVRLNSENLCFTELGMLV